MLLFREIKVKGENLKKISPKLSKLKFVKFVLILIFLIHISSSIRFNTLGLELLGKGNSPKTRFNRLGNFVIYNKFIKEYNCSFVQYFIPYSIFTGTNRGYEFYSPNVNDIWLDISYYSRGNLLDMPIKTREGKNKMMAMNNYLANHINNEGVRNNILKSIASRFFTLDSSLKIVDVIIEINKIKRLDSLKNGYFISKKNIKAFTISRYNK